MGTWAPGNDEGEGRKAVPEGREREAEREGTVPEISRFTEGNT
jgi:hypothetical protein